MPLLNLLINFYHGLLNNNNMNIRKNIISKEFIYHLSKEQNSILQNDIKKANNLLFAYKRLYGIPWKITFLNSEFEIENNFPHTHGNVIFLFDNYFNKNHDSRVLTLIHEKIHIYQRFFPIPYHKILLDYYKLNINSLLHRHEDFNQVRMNPDLNLLIYDDKGYYTLPILNENATTLYDTTLRHYGKQLNTTYSKLPQNEHPNETLAYHFSEMITQKNKLPDEITNLL